MQLESFPNETLLDLFEFINGVNLLRTFYGLNSRFDNLIFTHFRSNSLDFRSVSKTDFDIVCRQQLPSIINRIVSLRLSDDDETPQQIDCFLAHHLTLHQFIHLQSLSLSHIDSERTMDKMIDELHHLPHLRHLNISWCNFNRPSYVDSIWRLPKLIHCTLERTHSIDWFNIPTVKSTSLQHLSILHSTLKRFNFWRLLEYTPRLRHLAVDLLKNPSRQLLKFMTSSIETLSLSFVGSSDALEDIVQYMPNLSQLTVKMCGNTYVDGHRWKKMISDHLPKLKVFRLLMEFQFEDDIDGEEQVDKVLDSFRTDFWIHEHEWFVRCHWKSDLYKKFYCLYTLPYAFHRFVPDTGIRFKSVCSEDADCHSYDRVHDMTYRRSLSTDLVRLRFPNLHDLYLPLPIQDHFWSVVPTFHRLTSLIVDFSRDASALSQLQRLLDRAPCLYSLTLRDSPADVVNLTSTSIRRLELTGNNISFNKRTCTLFCRSPLAMQCEVLRIKVEDQTDIVYLVNQMKNLRALIVECKDFYPIRYDGKSDPSRPIEDERFRWLQQNLPPMCQISKHRAFSDFMILWIR